MIAKLMIAKLIAKLFKPPRELLAVFQSLRWLAILMLVACSLKKTAQETPVPKQNTFNKSFFVKANGARKTFLCGWMPMNRVGIVGLQTIENGYQLSSHCNVQFFIEKNTLVAKLINPSYPKDSSRWKSLVGFPITKHFYRENKKDGHGRDTNEIVENTTRSEWQARSHLEVSFEQTKILNLSSMTMPEGSVNLNARDIENTKFEGKSYLAFTVSQVSNWYGSEREADYRFNFLEFEHNPKFTKTPYHDANSRKINLINIVGKKVDGLYQQLYGAKWDIGDKPIRFRLVGFPEDMIHIADTVINELNIALTQAMDTSNTNPRSNPKTFLEVWVDEKAKFGFDLRYPSIHWIDDTQYSRFGPLGIAMGEADVLNGQILWGQTTIYGGMIESYLKSYRQAEVDSAKLTTDASFGSNPSFKHLPKLLEKLQAKQTHPDIP